MQVPPNSKPVKETSHFKESTNNWYRPLQIFLWIPTGQRFYSWQKPQDLFTHLFYHPPRSVTTSPLHGLSLTATTDKEKANLFNKYFNSVYSPASTCSMPTSITSTTFICEISISLLDAYETLANLNTTKATGLDGIGPKLLKSCAVALCGPLHHLFNISLKNSQIPAEWRLHRITPIFKSGERTSVSNYRPISLLSTVSKVLECLVYNKVIDFLSCSLSTSQFGFLRGRSTLQQLLIFLSSIFDNVDKNSKQMLSISTSTKRSTLFLMTNC